MMKRVVLLLAASMLVAVQSADAMSWKRVDKPLVVSGDKKFNVNLPVGWVQAIDEGSEVAATRDGVGIQMIIAFRTPLKKAFQSLETKAQKKANKMKLPKDRAYMVNANTLPTELAELQIAQIKGGSEMSHVRVISNAPCMIDGHPGFRIHFQYKNAKGLQFDHIVCGFVDDDNLYRLVYKAPSKIYFPRDIEAFDKMLASFRLGDGKSS